MDELLGNFDLSLVQPVVVSGVGLGFRNRDHHVLLLLPEHLLGGDRPLQVVLLQTQAGGHRGKCAALNPRVYYTEWPGADLNSKDNLSLTM